MKQCSGCKQFNIADDDPLLLCPSCAAKTYRDRTGKILCPYDLNETEFEVFKGVVLAAKASTGHDLSFGFTDNVNVPGLSKHQRDGYLRHLSTKNYIQTCDERGPYYHQFIFTKKSQDLAELILAELGV